MFKEMLFQEIKNLEGKLEAEKQLNKVLQKKLDVKEGSNYCLNKYYNDEISKLKLQKAGIRVELIKLRREHNKVLQDFGNVSKEASINEIDKLEKTVAELEHQLSDSKRNADETEKCKDETIHQLKKCLKEANDILTMNQKTLLSLDREAESMVVSFISVFVILPVTSQLKSTTFRQEFDWIGIKRKLSVKTLFNLKLKSNY